MSKYGKKGDVIEIVWDDSCAMNGWSTLDEVEGFAKDDGFYRSVGYLFGVRKKRVLMVQSISDYKQSQQRVTGTFAIPMSAIRSWKKIR